MGISIGNGFYSGKTGFSPFSGISSGSGLSFSGFGTAFTPLSLFSSGEPGAWYDPSDMSTMFQDASGATTVTAVEQPVSFLLDKSKSLALGSELVTNGTFNTNITGWTLAVGSGGSVAWNDGKLRLTRVGATSVSSPIAVTAGKTYKISAGATLISGAISAQLNVRAANDLSVNLVSATITFGSSTTLYYIAASTTTVYVHLTGAMADGVVDFDNVTAVEIAGSHAYTPSTATASRPVLSARVNLLERTEDLANAYWSNGVGLASRSTTSGYTTATENTSSSLHNIARNGLTTAPLGTNITVSAQFKSGTRRYLQFQWDNSTQGVGVVIDTQNWTIAPTTGGGTVTASSITNLGGGEYRVSVTGSVSSGSTNVNAAVFGLNSSTQDSVTYVGNGSTFVVGYIDLRVANDGVSLPVYQRVNTSTDYDTTNFPMYLRFDGSDDYMLTGTITPATDKAQVFAGVRKLSDAANSIVVESSINPSANNGTFYTAAPGGTPANDRYVFGSKGTTFAFANTGNAAYTAPHTAVMTGTGDVSGDVVTLRLNGSQAATSSSDQGTGNYLAYPLYIGRRGGTSNPLNGRIYGLVVRFGANLDNTQITNTETWMNGKTKAY